jgi:hypothetical protein
VRQAIAQWLDVAELENTTRERYDDLIRLHILPSLGDVQAASSTRSSLSASTLVCTAVGRSAAAGRAATTPVGR